MMSLEGRYRLQKGVAAKLVRNWLCWLCTICECVNEKITNKIEGDCFETVISSVFFSVTIK